MADHSFGWLCGTHYSAHLSDAQEATFSAVLVMPWASRTAHWSQDPADVPVLKQADCEQHLGNWLAPWEGTVSWALYALAAGRIRAIGQPRPVARAIVAADASRIAGRASLRLHAHARGNGNALSFETADDGRILSYPIVSGGVSQLPAALSDTVLRTSCVFKVARADLAAAENVVALPTFHSGGEVIAPADEGHIAASDPSAVEFVYGGAASRPLDGNSYSFSACVAKPVTPVEFRGTGINYPPRRVEIRNGKALRQIYATLSREFHPAKLWLAAMTTARVEMLRAPSFTRMLLEFLGGGEDELDEHGAVVGSLYELVLPQKDYRDLIGRLGADRPAAAQRLHTHFRAFTGNPAKVALLLGAMTRAAADFGLEEPRRAAEALAACASREFSDAAEAESALAHARTLAGALAAPAASARALWASWLAAVLAEVPRMAFPADAAYEKAARDASTNLLARARAALHDERASAPPVMEDDVLRLMNGQIDYAPTFWTHVHAAPNPSLGVEQAAERTQLVDSIEGRGWGLPGAEAVAVRTRLGEEYDLAAMRIAELMKTDAAEGDDPPFQLRYAAPSGNDEQDIRGCILAVRGGAPKASGDTDWRMPQWITTFEADDPDASAGTRIQDDAGAAMFIDTQGATHSDGLAEQEAVYDGKPLFAAEELEASSGARGPLLVRPVPPSLPPAPLAFGFEYEAICGTVDNAGAILEADLRDSQRCGVPKLDRAVFDALATDSAGNAIDPFRFLSRQPPGAPVIGRTLDHGVASETFTCEVLLPALGEPGAARLAVVHGSDGYASDGRSQTVPLYAPGVSPVFVERWLNADRLLPPGHPLRSDVIGNLDAGAIGDLIKDAREAPTVKAQEGERTQVGVSHPAVSHIAVRVTWYADGAAPLGTDGPFSLSLSHLTPDQKHWLRDEFVPLTIEQVATDDATQRRVSHDVAGNALTIRIPRRLRARVEVLSVIPAKYLDGGLQSRFSADAVAATHGPYVDAGDGTFVTRRPPSLWVESLPAVPSDAGPFNLPANALELSYPLLAGDAPALSVQLRRAASVGAAWIRGFSVEQKRWQWSGFQVAFPKSHDIAQWLALYAGAQDSMPRLPEGIFTSRLDAGWSLKTALMRPVPLPAQRAANHMGLIVTPIPRFARLLSSDVLERCAPVHLFAAVPASAREASARLQPPVWMEAIPLPHSRQALGNGSAAPSTPGNLAVFRDAVYDTSDTAVLGGIAEKLELDVPSTWEPQRPEAGVNPIFHPAPGGAAAAPWLTLDLPFGLSYDRVVGGRAAQTAAVIRLHGGEGKWVLAQCRVRRLIDPELVVGSELAQNATLAVLGLRLVEDGWIPEDIAVYCTTPLAHIKFGLALTLNLPPFAAAFPAVYLVTWHRDRWAQARPTWRPLVKVYRTESDKRTWRALQGTQGRLVGTDDFEPRGPGAIELTLSAAATVRRLSASEYTESRWLTFIGSFGLDEPASTASLTVRRNGSAFLLEAATAAEMPRVFKAGSLRTSLLLLFTPRRDLMRGREDKDGGELVGVYAMRNDVANHGVRAEFDLPLREMQTSAPCKAVLIQMQRHNVESNAEWSMGENEWPAMVDMMFPPQGADGSGAEASLRLLPEFIGEFDVA